MRTKPPGARAMDRSDVLIDPNAETATVAATRPQNTFLRHKRRREDIASPEGLRMMSMVIRRVFRSFDKFLHVNRKIEFGGRFEVFIMGHQYVPREPQISATMTPPGPCHCVSKNAKYLAKRPAGYAERRVDRWDGTPMALR
jgi:hypothetical protein